MNAQPTRIPSSASYGEQVAPDAVRFERLLPGPIERVWSYLVESDKRAQWLAGGEMEQKAGASFELFFHHASLSPEKAETPERFKKYESGISSQHRVLACEPPRLLTITWGDGKEDDSEVTFELAPAGERVRLVLTHRRLDGRKAMINVSGGWHTHLAVLEERLEGRTPPSFWTLFDGKEEEYERRFSKKA
jgi:uncharacterized protein YndB with AHSA1/START domain